MTPHPIDTVNNNQIKIALATGTMSAPGWRDALTHAFAEADLKFDLQIWEGKSIGARYAIVWLPPAELFATEPELRAVVNLGAGVDALLGRGVVPTSVPIIRLVDAGMAPKIAEYVCFAIARITRGLERFAPPPHGLRDWNASRPRGDAPVVGVLGLGAIGLPIVEAVMNFGYPVVGWSRSPRLERNIETFSGRAQFDAFLSRSEVLVNALPLTPQTENLLDRRAFAQMPRGAHVINVGRGGTIVDADLLAALDDGQLASATLDVFRVEPLPAEHPFWSHPKVTVTPHLSGPTPYGPAAEQIVAALTQLEHGVAAQDLPGYVDRGAGY
jgi:glyoxylate/hydroxypyruvate reductase A